MRFTPYFLSPYTVICCLKINKYKMYICILFPTFFQYLSQSKNLINSWSSSSKVSLVFSYYCLSIKYYLSSFTSSKLKAACHSYMCVKPNPLCWRHKILSTSVPCISAESTVEWTLLFLRTGFNPAVSSFIPLSWPRRQSCPKMPWRHIVEVQLHSFLASVLGAGERSASRPGRFTPWESAPSTQWAPELLGTIWRRDFPCSYPDSNPRPSSP